LIVLPDEFKVELERVKEHNSMIDEQIKNLHAGIDTLELRIQLASDKTLQGIINDVDDMGDLLLIDTKLKLIEK
jgi:hypothetical protein